ncbi:MAG: hypothetical protein A2904_00770 [Candidatus Staskawiczbacteria bacterium RIFCSPLOWO2_01_FULL_33_9]|uniref:GIY-YIG domain-containing protein n=1 Tax=Candidatus Staskawiczbacteria bacterium RIFCSPLOWO2_01_FULL_33_9 TaxID=1802211 RepID=A0A1G2I933_9BACT|nr:MAG: hypothetical protein A2904_00770 [Candidatus Staskawiczbacteria bacterium RIFCSPLOWO2_01_FULL_33_9]
MWFIYIIECEDKSFYTGITKDVERRFFEHKNKKGGKYTASHKPVKIVYIENSLTVSEALKRERQIKGWTHDKKIKIINNKKKPA